MNYDSRYADYPALASLISEISDLDERVKQYIPPRLSYSYRFWTVHLRKTAFHLALAEAIRAFFNHERLLFWFEVLSLFKMVNKAAGSLSSVIEWVKGRARALIFYIVVLTQTSPTTQNANISRTMLQVPSHIRPSHFLQHSPFIRICAAVFTKEVMHLHGVRKCIFFGVANRCRPQCILAGDSAGMRADFNVLCAAFSPDGKRVVLGLLWGAIQVWDAETGETLRPPFKGLQLSRLQISGPFFNWTFSIPKQGRLVPVPTSVTDSQ